MQRTWKTACTIIEIVIDMRRRAVKSHKMEKALIENCAPTLAGLKCANLFNYFHEGELIVREELEEMNDLLNGKGVFVDVLAWKDKSALVYVYRTSMLDEVLNKPRVPQFLKKYGYVTNEIDDCLKNLKCRLSDFDCFPHEIGIFLGYPLEDVYGFIKNKGKNCECCGVWKVYCNKEEKNLLFEKFQKCKEVYTKVFYEGREFARMIV